MKINTIKTKVDMQLCPLSTFISEQSTEGVDLGSFVPADGDVDISHTDNY